MNAPLFQPGSPCRDKVTGIPVDIIEPLPVRHPKTGQRLYATISPSGRVRRIQEANLRLRITH